MNGDDLMKVDQMSKFEQLLRSSPGYFYYQAAVWYGYLHPCNGAKQFTLSLIKSTW